jgi:uncharacterized membrane protein HdeD (DUF308 family)
VVSDIVTVLIRMMLGLEWPVSGAWAVGTFVDIDLMFDGWLLVMAGVTVHELGHRAVRLHLRLVRRTTAG